MGKVLTLFGGGGTFSPLTFGSLELWLDAGDVTTHTYNYWVTGYTVSGTSATNTLTASGDISSLIETDMLIRVGSNDVYAVASVSGTTITTKTNLTTTYGAETLYRQQLSAWSDKSTNANHATQATSGNQPIALDELSAIRFDSDFMETASNSAITGNADFTLCMVHKIQSLTSGSYGGWFGWGKR